MVSPLSSNPFAGSPPESVKAAIEEARARYIASNPRSQAADKDAAQYLPGGNTRTVLHFEPFPLTMVGGDGAELTDLDGHRYIDFVGEYSAALFGHSDEVIKAAMHEALDAGVTMGAPTPYERELAGLLCERFPSIDQVRFCNSGTEANLIALSTARVTTGRNTLLAFNDAYHGGVIKFLGGRCALNVPFEGAKEIVANSVFIIVFLQVGFAVGPGPGTTHAPSVRSSAASAASSRMGLPDMVGSLPRGH